MTFPKAVGLWALLGAVVPLLSRFVWWVLDSWVTNLSVHIACENATLMLWPSRIWTLPGDSTRELAAGLFAISTAANVVLYAAIGSLVWLGIHRHPVFLVAAAGGVLAFWWRVLTL